MGIIDRVSLDDEDAILAILDRHHEATAVRNVEALKQVFATEGYFIGTDDTDKWTRAQLLEALGETESGWDMTDCQERYVFSVPGYHLVATFFEVVRHKDYGFLRGSGTVIKEAGSWKISSYVLSFSVPNEVVYDTNILELLTQKT